MDYSKYYNEFPDYYIYVKYLDAKSSIINILLSNGIGKTNIHMSKKNIFKKMRWQR